MFPYPPLMPPSPLGKGEKKQTHGNAEKELKAFCGRSPQFLGGAVPQVGGAARRPPKRAAPTEPPQRRGRAQRAWHGSASTARNYRQRLRAAQPSAPRLSAGGWGGLEYPVDILLMPVDNIDTGKRRLAKHAATNRSGGRRAVGRACEARRDEKERRRAHCFPGACRYHSKE